MCSFQVSLLVQILELCGTDPGTLLILNGWTPFLRCLAHVLIPGCKERESRESGGGSGVLEA